MMSLGVCLPGGGAKGAFQAGVLKALYDRGIKKYDSYACTSIGAMIGYYLYTSNVDKLEKMWTTDRKTTKTTFTSVDNIIDNSEDFKPLYELKNNSIENSSRFYVNFLQVKDKIGKEKIVDISKFEDKCKVDYIKYSCALPYHKEGRLFSIEEVRQYISEGKFDGKNLDGGMARNTYFDPLIEDNVDKILIISTRQNFKLPDKVLEKVDGEKIIIISPKTYVDNKEMLNFSKDLCTKMYEEGYEIGKNFDLNLLK